MIPKIYFEIDLVETHFSREARSNWIIIAQSIFARRINNKENEPFIIGKYI